MTPPLAELPGILNWLIRGWMQGHLDPAAVDEMAEFRRVAASRN